MDSAQPDEDDNHAPESPEMDSGPLRDDVLNVIEGIEKLYDRRGAIAGLSTGFAAIDKITSGLQPARMYVIASRPSMGKSALASNIALHVALDLKKPVGFFSLEMSRNHLVQRLICSRAEVDLQKVRDGFLSERDFPKLIAAASALADCPLQIDDTPGLTIVDLRTKAWQMHERAASMGGLALMVIDYLQLLRSTSKRASDSRYVEVSEINAEIKALTKEMALPIILLSQLNRNPEARAGGRPQLSDLRDSGSIEDDADLVALLVRPECYAADEEERASLLGHTQLFIAKQRHGPTGELALTFRKEFTRFENVA